VSARITMSLTILSCPEQALLVAQPHQLSPFPTARSCTCTAGRQRGGLTCCNLAHCRSGDSVVVTARSAHGIRTTVRELQQEMGPGIRIKGASAGQRLNLRTAQAHSVMPACALYRRSALIAPDVIRYSSGVG